MDHADAEHDLIGCAVCDATHIGLERRWLHHQRELNQVRGLLGMEIGGRCVRHHSPGHALLFGFLARERMDVELEGGHLAVRAEHLVRGSPEIVLVAAGIAWTELGPNAAAVLDLFDIGE